MSPERLHVHGRCCSRQIQRNLIRGRKRFFPGHVFDIAGERIAQRAVGRSRWRQKYPSSAPQASRPALSPSRWALLLLRAACVRKRQSQPPEAGTKPSPWQAAAQWRASLSQLALTRVLGCGHSISFLLPEQIFISACSQSARSCTAEAASQPEGTPELSVQKGTYALLRHLVFGR